MGGASLGVFEGLLHYWPIVSMVGGGVLGWVFRTLKDYRQKDREDHDTLTALTEDVKGMKADLDAIKVGNVAEYQESISDAHTRYCKHGTPLTIAARGRINSMMQSLAVLDDADGTYRRLVDEINALPIWQPDELAKEDQ